MLFISAEDFFAQAENAPRLTREEEKRLAQELGQNTVARTRLICNYLPFVAGRIRRTPKDIHTLHTVYACLAVLEKEVDNFDFLQDHERFIHRLSGKMRQCLTRCLAELR